MNRPTKSRIKAIVYSCCWQSVSVCTCVGNGCILRRAGKARERWHEQGGTWGLVAGLYCCVGLLLPTLAAMTSAII